ncbi:sel1 repeat family protein [Shewanella schlegeliana]|uniref:Sel1 repeat family protein n=1 Tax=Shewanella schlegeliana TaxID=190308 RepID=A0ABS1ST58_9GAMM|nr:tetratricopeptide repeat protein [Shewanella schlegeliana]MBL4911731.1 sel1 repeat family protein [Shewanella schlegeliana]MCL1110317.1 sel1 repeat family protein [Shewanella schlegeliana]
MKQKLKGLGFSLAIFIVIVIFNSLFGAPPIALSGIEKYSDKVTVEQARELGFILFNDKRYSAARAFFKPSAQQGDVGSQLSLATLYFYDLTTVNNYQQAYYWFSKNSDNAFAQYYLSLLYHFGHYVPQSQIKSLFWTEKAAAHSFPAAQHNLAVYYYNLGDYSQAYLWGRYARDNNFSQARSLVKQVTEHLTPQEKAIADQTYRNSKAMHRWSGDKNNQISALLEQVF